MAMVLEDMGKAAHAGRSRNLKSKFHKMMNPDHGAGENVDPVMDQPHLSDEDLKALEGMGPGVNIGH
jgi:hypothetical protein